MMTSSKSVLGDNQATAKLFDAEILGRSLRQLAVDVIPGESTEFLSRWFHSNREDADLFVWLDGEGRIIKHQLCFFGQVVEWNAIGGTRTGVIVEEERVATTEDDSHHVAEVIRFDVRMQSSAIEQAIRVLGFVSDLSDQERSILIYNFRESPRLHKNARERAIKAWAPKVEEIISPVRPTFWKRLRKWVLGG